MLSNAKQIFVLTGFMKLGPGRKVETCPVLNFYWPNSEITGLGPVVQCKIWALANGNYLALPIVRMLYIKTWQEERGMAPQSLILGIKHLKIGS